MQSIAGGDLGSLHRESLAKAMQLLLQLGTTLNQSAERLCIATVSCAVSLGNQSSGAGAISHKERQPRKTFFAYETNFDALAVRLNRKNGNQSRIQEVNR